MFKSINFKMLFDSFENTSLLHYYLFLSDSLTLIITSGFIYMFVHFFILFFFKITLVVNDHINNITFLLIKSVISSLYDIVVNYLFYRFNLFFIFIGYIFIYIFLNNVVGLLPFSNTINNHLNITGMISLICWLGILFIGFKYFSTRFLSMFCVSGIPTVLIPILAFIEIVSYFFRFISLSLRLFANIVAGHILLETIYVFLFKSTFSNNNHSVLVLLLISIPSVFFILLILFEMIIACLQAYIFIVLCLIYIKDSLYLH